MRAGSGGVRPACRATHHARLSLSLFSLTAPLGVPSATRRGPSGRAERSPTPGRREPKSCGVLCRARTRSPGPRQTCATTAECPPGTRSRAEKTPDRRTRHRQRPPRLTRTGPGTTAPITEPPYRAAIVRKNARHRDAHHAYPPVATDRVPRFGQRTHTGAAEQLSTMTATSRRDPLPCLARHGSEWSLAKLPAGQHLVRPLAAGGCIRNRLFSWAIMRSDVWRRVSNRRQSATMLTIRPGTAMTLRTVLPSSSAATR